MMSFKKNLIGTAMLAFIAAKCVGTLYQDEKNTVQDLKAVPQILNDKTFEHWRKFIHPSTEELTWERVGWQTSLWAGLTLAQEKKMPLMVQFMTGHMCGMT